jgi:hypothetical protein
MLKTGYIYIYIYIDTVLWIIAVIGNVLKIRKYRRRFQYKDIVLMVVVKLLLFCYQHNYYILLLLLLLLSKNDILFQQIVIDQRIYFCRFCTFISLPH